MPSLDISHSSGGRCEISTSEMPHRGGATAGRVFGGHRPPLQLAAAESRTASGSRPVAGRGPTNDAKGTDELAARPYPRQGRRDWHGTTGGHRPRLQERPKNGRRVGRTAGPSLPKVGEVSRYALLVTGSDIRVDAGFLLRTECVTMIAVEDLK